METCLRWCVHGFINLIIFWRTSFSFFCVHVHFWYGSYTLFYKWGPWTGIRTSTFHSASRRSPEAGREGGRAWYSRKCPIKAYRLSRAWPHSRTHKCSNQMNKWQKSNQSKTINTKHTVPKLKTLQLSSCLFNIWPSCFSFAFSLHSDNIQYLHLETFLHFYVSQNSLKKKKHLSVSSQCPSHLLDPLAPRNAEHTHATVQISRLQIPCLAMHDQIKTKVKPQWQDKHRITAIHQ